MDTLPNNLILKSDAAIRQWVRALSIVFLLYLAGGIVVYAAAAEELASDPELLPMGAGVGAVLLVAIVVLALIGIILRGRERRQIEALLRSELWARWQYSAGEWEKHVTRLRDRVEGNIHLKKSVLSATIVTLVVVGGVSALIFAATNADSPEMSPYLLLIPVIMVPVVAGVTALSGLSQRWSARGQYRRQMRIATPQVYFGGDGVYHEADGFTSLRRFVSAKLTSRPAEIRLKIEVTYLDINDRYGAYGISTTVGEVRIPVPKGREDEAATLVERYQQSRGK